MARDEQDWRDGAEEDARDMFAEFQDAMVEQAVTGKVSDDLFNDYPGGDEYHHSTHVDKEYSLREAGELLEQLDDYEETDSGLWEGLEPRKAISAQAAYTYGNAVYSMWRDLVVDLNDDLEDIEFDNDEDREQFVKRFIPAYVFLRMPQEAGLPDGLVTQTKAQLSGGEFTGLLVLADAFDELGTNSAAAKARALRKWATEPPREDDDDDDSGDAEGDDREHRPVAGPEAPAD